MKKVIFTSILVIFAIFLANTFVIAQEIPSIEITDMAITKETNTYGLAVEVNVKNIAAGTKVDIAIDLIKKDSDPLYKQVCFDKEKTESNGFTCIHEVHQNVQVNFEIPEGDGLWLMLEVPKSYLDDAEQSKYYPAVGIWKPGKVGDADCTEDYLGSLVDTGCDYDQFVKEGYATWLPLEITDINVRGSKSTIFDGKTVLLINVADSEDLAIVAVDGEYETIVKDLTETINGLEITLIDAFYSEDYLSRSATLKIVKKN